MILQLKEPRVETVRNSELLGATVAFLDFVYEYVHICLHIITRQVNIAGLSVESDSITTREIIFLALDEFPDVSSCTYEISRFEINFNVSCAPDTHGHVR